MERRAKPRTVCETRWSSRADSLYTGFRTPYPVVLQSLETLSEDRDGNARGVLCSIKQFDFIITLCASEHVLSNTVALSKMLQGNKISFMKPTKPIQRRKTDNETFRWQTKWSHSTDEKAETLTETLQHTNSDLYLNRWSQSSFSVKCHPRKLLLARCAK